MSLQQLEVVIRDVVATFGAWGPETSLEEMRRSWDGLFADVPPEVGALAQAVDAGGVKAQWIAAPQARQDCAVLYLHGGGYMFGSVHSHRDMCERLSRAAQARVLALDYRLAPEHPFPAAVEDAASAYRWLLAQGLRPQRIAICGDSAGGGLAVATMLALKRAGDPLPGCAAAVSPWVDLEATGGSMETKAGDDPMVQKPFLELLARTYLGDGDLRNPLASPLYGDLAGLPPLLIHAGSRETLLDDALRLAERARQAGVEVELDIWDGQIHVFHIFASRLDEGEEAIRDIGDFIRRNID